MSDFGFHCCTRDTYRKIRESGYIRGPVWFFKDLTRARRFQRMRTKRRICLKFPVPADASPQKHYRTETHGMFLTQKAVQLDDCEIL